MNIQNITSYDCNQTYTNEPNFSIKWLIMSWYAIKQINQTNHSFLRCSCLIFLGDDHVMSIYDDWTKYWVCIDNRQDKKKWFNCLKKKKQFGNKVCLLCFFSSWFNFSSVHSNGWINQFKYIIEPCNYSNQKDCFSYCLQFQCLKKIDKLP